MHVYTVEMKT